MTAIYLVQFLLERTESRHKIKKQLSEASLKNQTERGLPWWRSG